MRAMRIRGSGRVSAFIQVAGFALPWALRRPLLNLLFGFDIDWTARIGLSLILANRFIMARGSRIGHFNLIRKMEMVVLGEGAKIFSRNQITGHLASGTFHDPLRESSLGLGAHAYITHHHILDCADSVSIGEYSILAGYRSTIHTHDIDVLNNQLCTLPVAIGARCYIGSGTIITKGTIVKDCCVVGAGSVLRGQYTESYVLLAGVPAKAVKDIHHSASFFTQGRHDG